jgi:group I intron endonuclease
MIGIYKFTNKKNGKSYVGQSTNIHRRLNEHLNRNEQLIDKAIKKHGVENFDFEVLEECSADQLNQKEIYWIEQTNSFVPQGYNLTLGGNNRAIGEFSAQSKLSNEDIFFIRTCYKNKVYNTSADLWREYYNYLSQTTIEGVFHGRNWTHLMMEVYTEELKEYYYNQYLKYAVGGRNRSGEINPAAIVAEKDAIKMRIAYQTKERKDIFEEFNNYSERTITSIISGQNWKHLPVYKKRDSKWIFPENWTEDQIEEFKIIWELQ